MKATVDDAMGKLPFPANEKWKLGVWDVEVMRHGSMNVQLFAPKGQDFQTPHEQDELYIIISGTGIFDLNGETMPFAPHDVIFVPAGVEHRFTDFSDDFATWVIFYGPIGGEKG